MNKLIYESGFGIIPKGFMIDPKISLSAKGIFALLCAYAGNGETAFPSIKTISYQLNIGIDTTQKYLKELRDNGYLEVTKVREGGKFAHNLYKLVPYPEIPTTVNPATETPTKVEEVSNKNSNNKNNDNKNNIYANIYKFYLSLGLIKHKCLNDAMKNAMKKAIKENKYTEEDMKELLKIHKNAVEATKGTNYAIKARPLHEFFGQKILGGTALICTQYEEGGKYYKYKNNQPKQPKKQEKSIKLEEMF